MTANRLRVVLVDDHAMVRFALAEAISDEPDLTLVAEASNGSEALELYRKHLPDVVTMDFQLPGADGAATTAALRVEFPDAHVLLLSVFEGEEDIWRAVQAGEPAHAVQIAAREVIDRLIDRAVVFDAHPGAPILVAPR